jgi:hypothetical protein
MTPAWASGSASSGAAMGRLDLALWLIRRASPELASLVSRYLLADIRSSQRRTSSPTTSRKPIPSSCGSNAGRASTFRKASP